MAVNRVRTQAHRVAWELANGPIPEGLHVLHVCDNPSCCNHAHLRIGTRSDNMQDALAKGRACVGDRHPARTRGDYLPHGEAHWMSKLTPAAVLAIRAEAGTAKRAELAKRHGVSITTIARVIRGENWRSV